MLTPMVERRGRTRCEAGFFTATIFSRAVMTVLSASASSCIGASVGASVGVELLIKQDVLLTRGMEASLMARLTVLNFAFFARLSALILALACLPSCPMVMGGKLGNGGGTGGG